MTIKQKLVQLKTTMTDDHHAKYIITRKVNIRNVYYKISTSKVSK